MRASDWFFVDLKKEYTMPNSNLTEEQRSIVADAKIKLVRANVRTAPLKSVEQSLMALTPSAPESVQNGTADR